MPIVAAVMALAAIVWGVLYARRGSLLIGGGIVLVVGYVFGYEFWNAHAGPLPLTIDRLLLFALVAMIGVQWRLGRITVRPLVAGDWALGLVLAIVAVSALFSGQPEYYLVGATSKWGRLLTSFLIPAALFVVIRQASISRRGWSSIVAGLALLGVYLAVTGGLEVAGRWSLVFPRYIADPLRGTHFGRARGPELNAVSLGLYLTATFWCAWSWMRQAPQRWQQLALFVALPVIAGGVFFTYTRSTWLGLAASGVVVASLEIPRRWRLPALSVAALAGLVVVAFAWSDLIGLEREGTAAESNHSVDQRTSFAYVSWQMFRDHPIFGVGFGRFYDQKLPYLSDRSQPFELESIRPLHHHNTLLSMLTETGLVGLAAFVTMLAVWTRAAWQLAMRRAAPAWMRAQGVLMLALLTNYLCSALFHDLSLIASQHLLLFAFAGLTTNLRQQCGQPALRFRFAHRKTAATIPVATVRPAAHAGLFGMQISRLTMRETADRLLGWCRQPRGEACRYVVTPNVDHAVLFQRRSDLRDAYRDAALVVADGTPIVWASRLLQQALPERVAGSDLVPSLFAAATAPLRVFLLGAAPGVAEAASRRIARQWPNVRVIATYSPPAGFEQSGEENARILAAIAAAAPDLLIVGLGAPKQELWVHQNRHHIQAKVALCVGATIDFLAEHRRRSPHWMRRAGLEWLHRLGTEPRRLAARYARDAWIFPQLVWREWSRRGTP